MKIKECGKCWSLLCVIPYGYTRKRGWCRKLEIPIAKIRKCPYKEETKR